MLKKAERRPERGWKDGRMETKTSKLEKGKEVADSAKVFAVSIWLAFNIR